MTRTRENGQAVILVIAAMGVMAIGAIGFALDGSHLFAQRQMAQTAADAAAQAAIMSIFNATNGSGAAAFSTAASFNCTTATTDFRTPCQYAAMNGFGKIASDTVAVSFPATATGVNLASPTEIVKVSVSRSVPTTLMRFLGATATTVTATATGAVVTAAGPVPLAILHPTLSGVLSINGNTQIKICGGPPISVQINSSSATAYTGGGTVDLSHAGPMDSGQCDTGTGADFGVWGGQTTNPGSVSLGTTGKYIAPSSPILDPLASVAAPLVPGSAGTTTSVGAGQYGCASSCTLYSPGLWSGGLNIKNDTAIFKPGLYYVSNGDFSLKNSTVSMCPSASCAADANTGNGMVAYHTGSGSFNIQTNVTATLLGAPYNSAYKGILFFQDRSAAATSHTFGQGNGCFTLQGTIYVTNTLALMQADASRYQSISYNGTPCSGTMVQGEIITDAISLVGNSQMNMNLNGSSYANVRQIALVN